MIHTHVHQRILSVLLLVTLTLAGSAAGSFGPRRSGFPPWRPLAAPGSRP